MSLVVTYEAGVGASSAEDISGRVRVGSLDVTQNAEEGAVALSTIIVDDPAGDYDIHAWRRIAIYETAGVAEVSQLVYNGFIVDRRIIRGPSRTGADRKWVVQVADTNCLLEMRIMTGADADRPAELDTDRIAWLLAESEMDRLPNHDYVNLTGGVAMDAADYRGQRAVDVINDCAQASGKNYFAFAIDAAGSIIPDAPGATHFWYDFADSAEYVSTLKLSNDLDDVLAEPGVCYEISLDTELARDPSRVYSGAYVRYDSGEEYEEDAAISAEFTRRDAVVPAENVKTSAKATARALRYLAEMSTEEDRVTTAVLLPAAKVNLIREGMRIEFKATHFPDAYRDFVPLRVLQRKVKQLTEEFYLVTLTLGWGPSVTALTGCANGGTLVFHTFAQDVGALWTLDTGPGVGGDADWTTVADDIPSDVDFEYEAAPGECAFRMYGKGNGVNLSRTAFDGVTWTPTGGVANYIEENHNGDPGFYAYANSETTSPGTASAWSFPAYNVATGGAIGGTADYKLEGGLPNQIIFTLEDL